MRVYLSPCGMGVGHVSRCKAVADALIERGSSILISTYSNGLEYANRLGYPTTEAVPLWLRMNSEDGIDFKLTAATSPGFFRGIWSILRQIIVEIREIQRFKPSLVVSDSRASSLIAARLLGVPSIAVLNQFRVRMARKPSKRRIGLLERIFFVIANVVWWFVSVMIGWFWSFAGKILIPDLPPPYTISSENIVIPRRCARKVEFVGPLLNRFSGNSSRTVENNKEIGDGSKPLILVPLSVSPGEESGFVRRIEQVLQELPDRYRVVMSRGKVSGSTEPERRGNLTVYDWIDGIEEYLEACDLVLSRAGHMTILGSLVYGKPLLVIPVPDHPEQLGNARRAVELGVAAVLTADQLTADLLTSTIDRMLNSREYSRHAAEIRDLARNMRGLERVISTIEQLSSGDDQPC